MFQIGPLELVVVLIVALLVIGPAKLPDVARSLGRGMREFRSALNDDDHDAEQPPRVPAPAPPAAQTPPPQAEPPAG
jgi:sec-independent protein translocase protein TatA